MWAACDLLFNVHNREISKQLNKTQRQDLLLWYLQTRGHGTGTVKKPSEKFACDRCGREFNTAMLLLVHQFEHNHLDVFFCVCDRTLSTKASLRRHVKAVHFH